MSALTYIQATIQFLPKGGVSSRQYSDRCLIELLTSTAGEFSLRAIDLDNKKERIFDIPLTTSSVYKFGESSNNFDQLRTDNGTYSLWLKPDSRDNFHKDLRNYFRELDSKGQRPIEVKSGKTTEQRSSTASTSTRIEVDPKKVLTDIYKLNQYIQQGREDRIPDKIERLTRSGVRLRVDNGMRQSEDEMLTIQVKIDGIDADIKDFGVTLNMDVYPFTKVHELRALFVYTHKFPAENQYFFVNGHLAHEQSTMDDLKVNQGSLFVLLVNKSS